MKSNVLLKSAAALLLGLLGMQKANAQAPFFGPSFIQGNQGSIPFRIFSAPNGIDGPYLEFVNSNNSFTQRAGSVAYLAGYSPDPNAIAHLFYTHFSPSNIEVRFQIKQNGKVQIGLTLPEQGPHSDALLTVSGKIVGQSLYVTRPSSWSDYVFSPSYKLLPLPELASYIKKNEHLPNIESASSAMSKGYDVSQMNAQLLQKVEELTLYVIQLNKKIELLEEKKQQ